MLLCVTQRLPISGAENNNHYGVEEARAVVLEMAKMKAGADPTSHGESAAGGVPLDGGVSPGEAVASSADGGVSPGGAADHSECMDVDDGELLVEEEQEAQQDPAMQKAESLMEAEGCHITIHPNREEFKKDVQARVRAATRSSL